LTQLTSDKTAIEISKEKFFAKKGSSLKKLVGTSALLKSREDGHQSGNFLHQYSLPNSNLAPSKEASRSPSNGQKKKLFPVKEKESPYNSPSVSKRQLPNIAIGITPGVLRSPILDIYSGSPSKLNNTSTKNLNGTKSFLQSNLLTNANHINHPGFHHLLKKNPEDNNGDVLKDQIRKVMGQNNSSLAAALNNNSSLRVPNVDLGTPKSPQSPNSSNSHNSNNSNNSLQTPNSPQIVNKTVAEYRARGRMSRFSVGQNPYAKPAPKNEEAKEEKPEMEKIPEENTAASKQAANKQAKTRAKSVQALKSLQKFEETPAHTQQQFTSLANT